jgi:hypothetical protein
LSEQVFAATLPSFEEEEEGDGDDDDDEEASDAGEARTVTSAGARATGKARGAENPSLQLAPGAFPLRYQATRLCFPGSSEVTVTEAAPPASRGIGGPRATPLSPKTTTPDAAPWGPGRRTLAVSVTGEQAEALGGSADSVMEHASYPCCVAGSIAVSEMP